MRQADVAIRAGVSQQTVSRVERGQLEALQVQTIRAVTRALQIDFDLGIRWRGGDIDRVADEGHAQLVGRIAAILTAIGWDVRPEVSFAVYRERGSIDLLAWHPGARIILVIEVKTSLNSVEETLRRHDMKVRLASKVAAELFGWSARSVARALVLPDVSTPRRRVARHAAVLSRAYPLRGDAARSWLGTPAGAAGLLLFLSSTPRGRGSRGPVMPRRVRRSTSDVSDHQSRMPGVSDAGDSVRRAQDSPVE
jgi:transcriptional regulator with XRE-family HTH domain